MPDADNHQSHAGDAGATSPPSSIVISIPEGAQLNDEARNALDRVVSELNKIGAGQVDGIYCAKVINEPCAWHFDCRIVG